MCVNWSYIPVLVWLTMTSQLARLFTTLKNSQYIPNPGHEQYIKTVLINKGWMHYTPPKSKQNVRRTVESISDDEMPTMSFIYQPFGSQRSPDFILKDDGGRVEQLEAKSSTMDFPMYNSGGVNPDYLYVFCSKTTDTTTIYRGSDIITPEQQAVIDAHIEDARQRDEEVNRKLHEMDINLRGIAYYTRPMIIQAGGKEFKNYFKHGNQGACEQGLLNWVEGDKLAESSGFP